MTKTRNNLSLKKLLIRLNVDLDELLNWIDQYYSVDSSFFLSEEDKIIPEQIHDILLLEDRRYFLHLGFELRSLPRGLKRYITYGKFGGTSTIEQLLVRTCTGRRERTVSRKIREIIFAAIINLHRSKEEILLAYINSAYFGPNMHGIIKASKFLFDTAPSNLTPEQSAFIASLLPYPLPPNIYYSVSDRDVFSSPEEILQLFQSSNPWWTSRVHKRMDYLASLRLTKKEVF
ncbi:Transglycosylase [Cohaesibacter marisflavi]|uniref:Transglycosylase n=1 Tax=Cohaesibacter marisflavi TaxID=655353 RepID=A0A1I5AF02_9HYPH|nr:biosynthetic peptidoglycan transglycosylase [Cohaesibacter marisflavi]SFN61017.1 Transglycosylase [Cohaesibacter marisflavi]